jgi:hypothetical protein
VTAQWGRKRAEIEQKLGIFLVQKLNKSSHFSRVTDEWGQKRKSKNLPPIAKLVPILS